MHRSQELYLINNRMRLKSATLWIFFLNISTKRSQERHNNRPTSQVIRDWYPWISTSQLLEAKITKPHTFRARFSPQKLFKKAFFTQKSVFWVKKDEIKREKFYLSPYRHKTIRKINFSCQKNDRYLINIIKNPPVFSKMINLLTYCLPNLNWWKKY